MGRAKQQRPQGVFPSLDHLRASLNGRSKHVAAMLRAGLLVKHKDGTVAIRNWQQWQSELQVTADRQRRFRARQNEGGVTRDTA